MADDPTMELALGQLNDLYSNGCFGDNALSDEFANTEANMASGEYAMTVNRLGLAGADRSRRSNGVGR